MENQDQRIEENSGMEQDYLAAIKELKSNTVSKEDYMKLKQENKQLLSSLVQGETINNPAEQKPVKSINELRSELFNGEHNNLQYVEKALELRDRLIEEGQPDPFLPSGKKIIATNEDIEAANRVADVLKECVEYADGDSQVFTNELQRRTNDTGPMRRR